MSVLRCLTLYTGFGLDDSSEYLPTFPADLDSPYAHYEEVKDVKTGSRERVLVNRALSNIKREQVEYEIPVQKTLSCENPPSCAQVVDCHPRTPATSVSSAFKGVSQYHSVVEYENTLLVM